VDGYEVFRSPTAVGAISLGGMERVATIHTDGAATKYFAPLRVEVIRQALQSVGGTIAPWFADPPVADLQGVYRRAEFDPEAIPLTAQTGTNYFQPGPGRGYDPDTAEIRSVPVPTNTDGTPPRLSVIYHTRRQIQASLSQAVNAGDLLLPQIQSVLGVYLSGDFDPMLDPIQNQDAQNLQNPNTVFEGHYLANLDITDRAKVTVLFQDQRLGVSYLEKLEVLDGRVFLPFGPSVQDILAVYELSDADNRMNLLETAGHFDSANWKLSGLPVPDGTLIRIFVTVKDLVWRDGTTYRRIVLPKAAGDGQIVAVLPYPADDLDLSDTDFISEANILPATHVIRESALLFSSDLPMGTHVGLVVEDSNTQRSLVCIDDRTYQYTDEEADSQAHLYRIVAFRREKINGEQTLTIRSAPSKPL